MIDHQICLYYANITQYIDCTVETQPLVLNFPSSLTLSVLELSLIGAPDEAQRGRRSSLKRLMSVESCSSMQGCDRVTASSLGCWVALALSGLLGCTFLVHQTAPALLPILHLPCSLGRKCAVHSPAQHLPVELLLLDCTGLIKGLRASVVHV